MSGQDEKEFEVSFDGSFARGFEGTEFIVSLPIINGREKDGAKDYSPKRGEEGSPDSKSGGEEELSKDEQSPPSYMRKVAWAWERRALRAEESLKRYQEGLMDRTGEGKLKDTLSFLLNSDSGIIDEGNMSLGNKSRWEERAFDTMDKDKWVVLKVPQANQSHVLCDFCDGDELDDKHWLEGPFSQNMTVRELLEYQRGSDRVQRRACTDNHLCKARRRGPRQKMVEKPTTRSAGVMCESEMKRAKADFRNRVDSYNHVDLLETERKRKRKREREKERARKREKHSR